MVVQGQFHEAGAVLPAGDPRRLLVGRAALGTLLAAAAFLVFTATKQVKAIYVHAPWLNDPYDTVFSFTMFFVPLVAAYVLVQVSVCRRSEPLPIARVVSMLRACRVVVGAVVVELLFAWWATAVGANRSAWSTGATGALLGALSVCSIVTTAVAVNLRRVPRLGMPRQTRNAPAPDWLADAVTVARRESDLLGPFRGAGLRAVNWTERTLVVTIRRRPLAAAAVASAGFGIAVFGWQAIREGYSLSVTVLSMALGFCGMFAFLVGAGSYLGVVRSPTALWGLRRRAVDASVAACTAAVAALAFRDALWWIIGSNSSAAGPAQFTILVSGAALLAFVVALTVETLLRSHI